MKSPKLRAYWLILKTVICLLVVGASGCGGGTGGGGNGRGGNGGGTQSEDFALTVSPSSLPLNVSGTAAFRVSVSGSNGFDGTVSLSLAGLPAGVTASPNSPEASPGAAAQITLSAGSTAAVSSSTLTVSGVSGSLKHTATLSLNIQPEPVDVPLPRTRYVRTDMVTEFPFLLNANWEVFNSNTGRFFISDPSGNQIVVMDAKTEKEIASITVPGAFGIDETPDGTLLYAGTLEGDIYAVDPVSMKVTHRYQSSQIGPYGYHAGVVRVLASGKLVLLYGNGDGINGSIGFAIWNPSDNSIVQYEGALGGPTLPNCLGHIGAFTLTGDRSLIVEGSIDSDGTLCTVDPQTGEKNVVYGGSGFIRNVFPTPDGKSLLVRRYGTGVTMLVFDAHTLTQTSSFPVTSAAGSSMIVSTDSKTLYIDGGEILYAYDIASGKLVGWTPNLTVEPLSGGMVMGGSLYGPQLQAFDNSGLIAGPMEEGIGFIDTSSLQTGPVGTQFGNSYATPATGPVYGGTVVQWNGQSSAATPVQAYFGNHAVADLPVSSGGSFSATSPQGSPGPVDIYTLMDDGGEQIVPEAFSYGPTILQATPNASTSEGGGTGILYGYGFGSTSSYSIPPGISITVGGQPATVTGYSGNAYNLLSPPFPWKRWLTPSRREQPGLPRTSKCSPTPAQ